MSLATDAPPQPRVAAVEEAQAREVEVGKKGTVLNLHTPRVRVRIRNTGTGQPPVRLLFTFQTLLCPCSGTATAAAHVLTELA